MKVLKVARLVVLGHGQCGGVKAMAYGAPPQARDFIASWVEIGKPAVKAAGEAAEGRLEPDRGGGRSPVARQPRDLPLDRRGGRRRPAALQGYLFDVHTGVLAASARTG